MNLKQFRQLLGLTSYYRRFIPGYARLAHPLHALTRKAEANITVVGHQTKTGHKCHVTKHTVTQSVKMAGQKRPSERTLQQTLSSGSSTAGAKKNKRQVSLSTFKKWQQKYDSQSLSWLKCEVDKTDKTLVAHLYCSACREYQSKLRSMKNYSSVCINGSDNQ